LLHISGLPPLHSDFIFLELLQEAIVDPNINFTVWQYYTQALAPSPNMCWLCGDRNGDLYELKDPDDLLNMFPYGEWVDEDTFAVNQHPHCLCVIKRKKNVYYK
jgi:hypothetical protein